MNLKELGEKRRAAAKRASDIVALAREENRALTTEEQQQLDGHVTEAKGWQDKEAAEIKRAAQLSEIESLGAGDSTKGADGAGGAPVDWAASGTIGDRIRNSDQYKALRQGNLKTANVLEIPNAEFKTLVTLATLTPQNLRRPGVVAMALEERTVSDMMLESPVDRAVVEYYEETTVTNNAATVAEAGTKAESAIGFTLRSDTIRKIATWIPATDEVLADVPFMEAQIRGRLVFMVKRTEEAQILGGDGIAPNILGVLNRTGIQTQAKGADNVMTALFKAINKVRNTGFAEPTGIVMHPTDYANMVTTQGTDGSYLFGPISRDLPMNIWGLDIRVTTGMTLGTALVGAFRPWSEVLRRTGITVVLSTEHSTYFIENKVAILAEERLGLAVYRPAGFCTVTGL